MAVKQIVLRGISRTPSDRMNSDGGVAESLNFQIEEQESAPVGLPSKVDVDRPMKDNSNIIYIHKTQDYENYIWLIRGEQNIVSFYNKNTGEFEEIFNVGDSEINTVNSLGNTLIVSTDSKTIWAIYNNGKYRSLGDKMPFPKFTLFAKRYVHGDRIDGTQVGLRVWSETTGLTLEEYRQDNSYENDTDSRYAPKLKVISETIDTLLARNRNVGLICNQALFVVALRLYDDTCITSVPMLLSPGYKFPYETLGRAWTEVSYYLDDESGELKPIYTNREAYFTGIKYAYRPVFKMEEDSSFFNDWRDVIKSIDIFMSPRLYYDHYEKRKIRKLGESITLEGQWQATQYRFEFANKNWTYEKEFSSISNFFLLKSYKLNKDGKIDVEVMDSLTQGEEINIAKIPDGEGGTIDLSSEDKLVTQEQLSVGYDNKNYSIIFNQGSIYNNRIIASGIKQIVEFPKTSIVAVDYSDSVKESQNNVGQSGFASDSEWGEVDPGNGQNPVIPTPTPPTPIPELNLRYTVRFLIQKNDGKEYVINNPGSDKNFTYENILNYRYGLVPYSLIVCPDVRAKKVEIVEWMRDSNTNEYKEIRSGVFDMKEHPFLPVSYFNGGMDIPLRDLLSSHSGEKLGDSHDSIIDNLSNKLFVSKVDNPLVFPERYRYTFQHEIVGTAIATAEMSTGQFGQFPLYVFTKGGIWAMEVNSEGEFVTNKPLSRFIALSNKGIQSVDNAVVFPTEKGLMAISGSQVTELSPTMMGKHYSLEQSVVSTILKWGEGSHYNLLPSVADEYGNFMAFLKEADVVYDYIGNRIILFNREKSYAYLMYMKSGTWHKISLPDGCYFATSLNSYPDAKVVLSDSKSIHRMMRITDLRGKTAENIGNGLYSFLVSFKGLELTREQCIDFATGTQFDLTFYDDRKSATSLESDLRSILTTADVGFDVYNGFASEDVVYDYSSILDHNDTSTEVDSVIITRTIDLDNPDVLKTINHLKIRGRYERYYESDEVLLTVSRWTTSQRSVRLQAIEYSLNQIGVTMDDEWKNKLLDTGSVKVNRHSFNVDEFIRRMGIGYTGAAEIEAKVVNKPRVSYILLGSQDGINFARLGSLRGKSWKMFRIVILARLRPHERISWIDIDYETRFTNKLR